MGFQCSTGTLRESTDNLTEKPCELFVFVSFSRALRMISIILIYDKQGCLVEKKAEII